MKQTRAPLDYAVSPGANTRLVGTRPPFTFGKGFAHENKDALNTSTRSTPQRRCNSKNARDDKFSYHKSLFIQTNSQIGQRDDRDC